MMNTAAAIRRTASSRQEPQDMARTYDHHQERSSLIAVLSVIAGVLALALGVLGVLYLTGFFNRDTGAAVATATQPTLPAPQPSATTPATPTTAIARNALATATSDVEPPIRATYGDWQLRCDTPAGARSEQCVLMQFVTAEDRDNVGLTVIILKTADKQARIMRVLAPLGVLLPKALGLNIDQTDLGLAGFVRCLPNGCVAEAIIDDSLMQRLNSGQTATFIIYQTPEEGIGIPISLNGFQDGFAALP
jgi:invasion protein IalB